MLNSVHRSHSYRGYGAAFAGFVAFAAIFYLLARPVSAGAGAYVPLQQAAEVASLQNYVLGHCGQAAPAAVQAQYSSMAATLASHLVSTGNTSTVPNWSTASAAICQPAVHKLSGPVVPLNYGSQIKAMSSWVVNHCSTSSSAVAQAGYTSQANNLAKQLKRDGNTSNVPSADVASDLLCGSTGGSVG